MRGFLIPFPPNLLNPMPTPEPSPGRTLAETIAAIHGTKPVTITVKMVGGQAVADLLKKVQQARKTPPSKYLRVNKLEPNLTLFSKC